MKIQTANIFFIIIFGYINCFGQRKVSGYVYDQNDKPLINANISELGTKNGTISDSIGYFECIYSNDKSHITVSKVGYNAYTFSPKRFSDTINVRLEEYNELIDDGCWILPREYFEFSYVFSPSTPCGLELIHFTYSLDISVLLNSDLSDKHEFNFSLNKTFLNKKNCPIFSLDYSLNYRNKYDIIGNWYKLASHDLLAEREKGRYKYGVGIGYSDINVGNYSKKKVRGILLFNCSFYKTRSSLLIKTYYSMDYMQLNCDFRIDLTRKFDLILSCETNKYFKDLYLKVGYKINRNNR